MQKLIERIGTEPQKFKFTLFVSRIRTNHPTKENYRVVLRREDKQFYSGYFKIEPNKDNETR